ncbi:hypothetical protein ACMYR3_02855 [Ampullimonas aquatilis]|uniref:hypothetical protein n=1 Tax=Ampullimonas aquatilis TaxID=1341549 RepID=UPI003C75995B
MIKVLTIYLHLIATCAAIGGILISDSRLAKHFFQTSTDRRKINLKLEIKIITTALAVLWATGILLIALNLSENPNYLSNPKLQVKISLVILLTLNGLVLHFISLPNLSKGIAKTSLLKMTLPASLSNTTWLYCAFLGVARPWNFAKPIEYVGGIWLACWVTVFLIMSLAVRFAKSKNTTAGYGTEVRFFNS